MLCRTGVALERADLIQHADGRRYLRTGVCDGCKGLASCCTFLMLPLARSLSVDEQDWVRLHPGVSIVGGSVRIDSACSALDGDGKCSLFGMPERPALCVRYPEQPEQMLPDCSYELVAV
jgi:Fe-S-cluster containining protein